MHRRFFCREEKSGQTSSMSRTYETIREQFFSFKTTAGDPQYVSCFGKTFVDSNSDAYKVSVATGEAIINAGFGVIHGGYIGTMEAVSRGASEAIKKSEQANKYWNIGVPMKLFEPDVKRADCQHL